MNAGRFGSGEVEGRRLCHRVAEGPLLGGPRCRGAPLAGLLHHFITLWPGCRCAGR